MKFAAQRIVLLAGFMFIVSVVTQSFASENVQAIKFTETEQKWLDEKRILRFSEVNWKPLSDVDHFPDYQGIIAEYLKIVSDATGMKLDFQKSNIWHEVITKFRDGKIDLIPAVSIRDDIGPNIVFTQPYITFPLVIATRLDADFIGYTNELNGKKVGVGRNYTSYFFLKNNYPQITLIQTDDVLQGLRLLEKKEIDAFVGHLAVIDHIIKHTNIGVKIAGKTEYDFEHRVGINKENNGAVEIFNKVFSSIGSRQHNLILRNNVRQMDTVGRWGGEEFLIVCTNTDIFGAKETAEKLHRYIQSYHFPEIRSMTASFGIAQCGKAESIKDLFVRIDAALYRAKANGKNRVEIA